MSNNRKYFAHQKFYRLTLIEEVKESEGSTSKWLCLCDCGSYKIMRIPEVKAGKVKSCGCLTSDRRIIHNRSEKLLHQVLHGVKARCYNPSKEQAIQRLWRKRGYSL